MVEVPDSMMTRVTFCCCFFLFSHSNACDAHIVIITSFSCFVKSSIAISKITLNKMIENDSDMKQTNNTLQEHHQFWTKMTISVISDTLKSMGKTFQIG